MEPWLLVEAKTSPRTKKLGKHWNRLCFDWTYHTSTCFYFHKAFSIFLEDMYIDHSNLLSKSTAKLNDVAKMLDVIPAECEKSFGV